MNKSLNIYGDTPKFLADGHGADISSQRADDLDLLAVEFIHKRHAAGSQSYCIDVACGEGGQAIRMAQAGAVVLGVDIMDGKRLAENIERLGLQDKVKFLQEDMRHLSRFGVANANLIICQRAIHYLPFDQAVDVVSQMKCLLAPGGLLYLSASGMLSELGDGYLDRDAPLQKRYGNLSPQMQAKHGIHGPVCLYLETDIEDLISQAGLVSTKVFSSAFGNIKAVAINE